MVIMRGLCILGILLLPVACQAVEPTVSVLEVPQVEPYVEPTGTPDCQPSQEVKLEVQKTGPRSVSLHASGLQPGETPRVIFGASTERFGAFGDTGIPEDGADEQGGFSLELGALVLGYGSPDAPSSAVWDIRLIHARGVACAEISLP
jgi:hypothetical protein